MSVSLQKAVVYLGEAGNVRGVPFNAAQNIRSPLRGWCGPLGVPCQRLQFHSSPIRLCPWLRSVPMIPTPIPVDLPLSLDSSAPVAQLPAAIDNPACIWATGPDEFKLTDNQAAQHHFSLCSSQGEVDESMHVACLADEDGVVCFDLLPNERFAG